MCRDRQEASSPDDASRSAPNSRSVSSIRYCSPSRSTTDLSTSPISALTTSGRSSDTSAHTSSAAPRLNRPANTDSRAHSRRSAAEHSSYDHSIAVRSVLCLGSAPGRPVDSSANRWSSRSTSSASGSVRSGIAASSIASGMPSSRRHSRMTSATFVRGDREAGRRGGGAQREQLDRVPAVRPARPAAGARASRLPAPAAARQGRCARPPCQAAAVRWRAPSRPARPRAPPGPARRRRRARARRCQGSAAAHAPAGTRAARQAPTWSPARAGRARWRPCWAAAPDRAGRKARRSTGRRGSWSPPARPRRAPPGSCRPRPAPRSSPGGTARAPPRVARARPACRRDRCTRQVESVRTLNYSPPTLTRSVRARSGPGDSSCLHIPPSATSRHRESQVHEPFR